MLSTKIFLASTIVLFTSIYSIHFNTITGTDSTMAPLQGKKILIVNIATNSREINQIAGLQRLYELYHDSLMVIAFPSNSFGHENRTNSEIKSLCEGYFHTNFLIAEKGDVSGAGQQPVFQWLTQQSENGVMNAPAYTDYCKFLLDKNGSLIATFGPDILPTDSLIKNAITSNQ